MFSSILRLLAPVALAPVALAQVAAEPVQPQAQAPRGGLNPDSFYAKESIQGVSVRDSLEAIKKLEDARRMERLRDWNKAADWYQEVIEKYGDRVVPSQADRNNQIYQYTGIERPVQEQLAKWPKEGLDSYRNRYGAVAQTMLEQARRDDRETLSRVMKLYFITDAGRAAGIKLIDLLLENGEFPEAARLGDRLLDWHPSMELERAKVLFRTSLAYHLAGDAKRAKERADQMNGKYADATGTLFGKDVALGDALGRLLQQTPPSSIATQTGSIRLNPGGDESRSQVSAAAGRSGARIASIDLSDPPIPRGFSQQQVRELEQFGRQRDSVQNLGIMPVVDEEELYFQDGSRIYAVSLQSGVPLPGWIQTYPNTQGQYTVPSWSPVRSQQHTLTLTDQNVLAVMGVSERLANFGITTYGERGTRLVCLNRSDGREKWVVRKDKLPDDALRGLDFSGSPLVVGDSVYVIGRGGKNLNAEDCYVLCFNLADGSYKWSCFIASANNYYAFAGQPTLGDSLSHLAYSSGRVFVLTNLGACAALDAYSGTISWLNIYPRDAMNMNPEMGWRMQRQMSTNNVQGWEYNPVVVRDGKVFVLPTDGRHLVVYDAGSGVEFRRLSLSEIRDTTAPPGHGDQELPQALLAVDNKHLILASERAVYSMDWVSDADSMRDRIQWANSFGARIRGRPFVTADSVFVCTTTEIVRAGGQDIRFAGQLRRIARFRPDGAPDGKVVESYPSNDREWDAEGGEGPGNVLVTGDQVIIATTGRVNVYADMILARKRLDDDVAAAQHDPKPRLRYAEVMFVAGQLPVAMEKLNEAVQLLGGLAAMRPGPERDHLFNDCITFALKLQKDKKLEDADERVEAINKLYDLAGSAAHGDSQQVNYRISRARFNRDFQQPNSLTEAVRLYQEVLTNPKLRIVPLIDQEAGGATQAGLVAEKSIAEVVKIKPEAYQKFEEQATLALAAAGQDPAALKAVAESYPNASAAAKSMIAAAQSYEKQGNHRLATHTLRQAYAKYAPNQSNEVKVRLLEGMARNYLAIPERVDVTAARLSAIVRLGKGDDKLEKPLALPDGKRLVEAGTTFNQALKAVQAYTTQAVVAKLPDFHLPAPPTDEEKLARYMADLKWKEEGADPAKRPYVDVPVFVPGPQMLVIDNVQALLGPPTQLRRYHARHDRVVGWSNGNLAIYAVGSKEPVGRAAVAGERPEHVAWLDQGKSLLVWGDSQVALVGGNDAQVKWKLELKSLPKIEVIAGGAGTDQTVGSENAGNDEQVFMGNGRAMRRRVIQPRIVPQMPVQPNAGVPAGGPEQMLHIRPIDDRILIATSAGQLFAVKAADGTIAWHTRLSASSPIERMLATDDFVVSMITEGNTRQLVAVDTLNGQLVRRISSADGVNVPINAALAPDGMLVWVTPDRICGKDLFEPSKELNYGEAPSADARFGNANVNVAVNAQPYATIYAGAVNPDQLLISEGRVLVVSHNGKFVSMHSLESGRLLDYKQPDGRTAEARLLTSYAQQGVPPSDWNVGMHLVGSMLYVTSAHGGPMAYDLDRPDRGWSGQVEPQSPHVFDHHDPMIDPMFLVLRGRVLRPPGLGGPGVMRNPNVNPNVPVPVPLPAGVQGVPGAPGVAGAAQAAPQAPPATSIHFNAYSRKRIDGRESGVLAHSIDVRDEAGVTTLEPVEGGFYYLSGDQKLKFLKGTRQ